MAKTDKFTGCQLPVAALEVRMFFPQSYYGFQCLDEARGTFELEH